MSKDIHMHEALRLVENFTNYGSHDDAGEFVVQEGGARDARVVSAKANRIAAGVRSAANLRKTGAVTGVQAAGIAAAAHKDNQIPVKKQSYIGYRASSAARRRANYIARTGANPNLSAEEIARRIARARGHTERDKATRKTIDAAGAINRSRIRSVSNVSPLQKAETRASRHYAIGSYRGSASDELRTKRPTPTPKPKPVVSTTPKPQPKKRSMLSRLLRSEQ
jgi:hypothetical protein